MSRDLDYLYIHWLPLPVDAVDGPSPFPLICSLLLKDLSFYFVHIKFGFDRPKWFQRRSLNIMLIYMHVVSGGGRCAPGVHFFSESLIFSPTTHFLQYFFFE